MKFLLLRQRCSYYQQLSFLLKLRVINRYAFTHNPLLTAVIYNIYYSAESLLYTYILVTAALLVLPVSLSVCPMRVRKILRR